MSIDRKRGIGFFFIDQTLLSSSASPLTFAAAAFFGAAVVLLFVALVVRLLAPETRSRASERCCPEAIAFGFFFSARPSTECENGKKTKMKK